LKKMRSIFGAGDYIPADRNLFENFLLGPLGTAYDSLLRA